MMLVAIVLALGFSVLVMLAFFLCLIISFVPPVTWPSNSFRILVVFVSVALAFISGQSVKGSQEFEHGLGDLLHAMQKLQELLQQVARNGQTLTNITAVLNSSAFEVGVCAKCVQHADPNMTTLCGALESAAGAAQHAKDVNATATLGVREIDHLVHVLNVSTSWHQWAAVLPLFALICTSAAIITGSIAGRRNLLVLAQFFAVIVWWMMCAVISVEFAIAVAVADGCVQPLATVRRVLLTLASQASGKKVPRPSDLWNFNVTEHYLANCSQSNPLTYPLQPLISTLNMIAHHSTELPMHCHPGALPAATRMSHAMVAAQQGAANALLPFGTCPTDGMPNSTVVALFGEGIQQGLCNGMASGFVDLFFWQAMSSACLLLLSLLLPGIWHSRHLPPLSWTSFRWYGPRHRATRLRDESVGPSLPPDPPMLVQPPDAAPHVPSVGLNSGPSAVQTAHVSTPEREQSGEHEEGCAATIAALPRALSNLSQHEVL